MDANNQPNMKNERPFDRLKICLVCSNGGHLMQMLRLKDAFKDHNTFLVTQKRKYSVPLDDISNIYLIRYIILDFNHRYLSRLFLLINMMLYTLSGLIILLKERPDIVVSTGSEIAIPFLYIAKLLRRKVIFIETLHRVNELSGTAKLTYPILDLFFVQWEPLLKDHPKARYAGRVI